MRNGVVFKHTLYFPTLCIGVGVGQGFGTVEVDVELRKRNNCKDFATMEEIPEMLEFSACASAKGHHGQCLDFVNKEGRDFMIPTEYKELWDRVFYIWNRYHLNTMKAGTKWQEDFLKEARENLSEELKRKDTYTLVIEHAFGDVVEDNEGESIRFDFHTPNAKGYAYGSSWLAEQIPDDIIEEVKSWAKYSRPDATEIKKLRRELRVKWLKENKANN